MAPLNLLESPSFVHLRNSTPSWISFPDICALFPPLPPVHPLKISTFQFQLNGGRGVFSFTSREGSSALSHGCTHSDSPALQIMVSQDQCVCQHKTTFCWQFIPSIHTLCLQVFFLIPIQVLKIQAFKSQIFLEDVSPQRMQNGQKQLLIP